MGGAGIHEELSGNAFNVTYRNISADGNLGHQFDLYAGNTTTLIGCYAMRVPTDGTAGYRIRSAAPTLIGCNGIDGGQYWGIFGSAPALDGGTTEEYCVPTLIGCNVEDFSLVGTQHRTSSPIIINSVYTAATSGTASAIRYDYQPNNNGQWINSSVISRGAAWLNGQPFHCKNSAPFLIYTGQPANYNNFYEYYDDQAGIP